MYEEKTDDRSRNESTRVYIKKSRWQEISLSDFKGSKVILYFYPKDNTPGCTQQAYDVWKEKNMYGKKTMGVVRSSFLIDENGVIVKIATKVKAAANPIEMLELLNS